MRCLPLVGIAAGCIILGALSTAVTLAARHDLNAVNQVAGIVGTAAGVASLIVAVWDSGGDNRRLRMLLAHRSDELR